MIELIDEGKGSFIETILLGPIGDVDHTSKAGIFLLQSVVSLVEVLEVEVLVNRDHVVVGTELQHFLHLLLTSHIRASNCNLVVD